MYHLRNLDLMSPHINLTVGGQSGIKTLFGVGMTVLCLTSIISFTYIIMQSYFSTLEPIIYQEHSEEEKTFRMDLANDNFALLFHVLHASSPLPAGDYLKYITPVLLKRKSRFTNSPGGIIIRESELIKMPIVPCAQLSPESTKYYMRYRGYETSLISSNISALCVEIDPDELYVDGSYTDRNLDDIALNIYPCSLPSGCVSKEELENISIGLGTPSYHTDYSNYDNPIQRYLSGNGIYSLNHMTIQRYEYEFINNQVLDDRGVWAEKTVKFDFNSLSTPRFSLGARNETQTECGDVDSPSCKQYLSFDFRSSGKRVKIQRTYKGLTKTMSELGGSYSICLMVFMYLNLSYLYFKKHAYMIERTFPIHSLIRYLDLQRSTCKYEVGDAINIPLERKKSSIEQDMKRRAEKMVREGLDAEGIIKELSSLRVITNLLLKDYHQELIPLLAITMSPTSSGTTTSHGNDRDKRKVHHKKSIDMQSAMDKLERSFQISSQVPPGERSIDQRVDVLYWNEFSKYLDKSKDKDFVEVEIIDIKQADVPKDQDEVPCTNSPYSDAGRMIRVKDSVTFQMAAQRDSIRKVGKHLKMKNVVIKESISSMGMKRIEEQRDHNR